MSFKIYKPSNECIEAIKYDTFNKSCGSASEILTKFNSTSLPYVVNSRLNNRLIYHNSTNQIGINYKTLKYLIILLITSCLIIYLSFIFIFGVLSLNKCSLEPNIPIFLIISSLLGHLRLFLLFLCPFRYSDSVLTKMKFNLFNLLLIKRFKHSYNTSKDFKCCFFKLLFNYFCSCCCGSKTSILKNDYYDSYSTTDSSVISVVLSDCCCLQLVNSCSNRHSFEIESNKLKLKRSVSLSYSRKDIFYSNNYHKKMRRKHNKIQKDYKLIDFRSVRYGAAHLLQRLLDLFMLLWFICGNYWVFSVNFDSISNNKNSTKLLDLKNSTLLVKQITYFKNRNFLQLTTTNVVKCSAICFHIAFSHIIITYSFFVVGFIIVISFRIYSLKPDELKKSAYSNKRKFRSRASSLP